MLIQKYVFIGFVAALYVGGVMSVTSCASTKQQESTGQYIDDSALTLKVKSALLANNDIKSLGITVKTYKNIVELSGFVDTAAQKTAALNAARHIDGVKAVVDALVVKSPQL